MTLTSSGVLPFADVFQDVAISLILHAIILKHGIRSIVNVLACRQLVQHRKYWTEILAYADVQRLNRNVRQAKDGAKRIVDVNVYSRLAEVDTIKIEILANVNFYQL